MTVMDTLRKHPKVEIVDDERSSGNGVIVTLKQGWSFDVRCDNRVAGEDTPTKALASLRGVQPYGGPYDD